MSAMCIFSRTSSICSSSFCWDCVRGFLTAMQRLADRPEKDRLVRFADVATGNSFIDGFPQALVVGCGADTIFSGADFLFCIVFGVEFLAVGFACLVLTSIGSSVVVVCGIDVFSEKGRFPLPVRSV